MENQVEYDTFGNKVYPKICPLTGERVTSGHMYEWSCLEYDCNDVDENQWYCLYGRRFHCRHERNEIVAWHTRQIKAEETYKKLNNSLDTARLIDVKEFFAYCDSIDKDMIANRQEYQRNMVLDLYHDDDEKCLIYFFEDDVVSEICITDNPFSLISVRFDRLRDRSKKTALSCCSVPAYMAEAVNVREHLQHDMDVKAILHNDNPVYIKARNIGKYVDAVYGWEWLTWKRVRDRHLELTEIVNYDNIIYIKQDLDEIVRKEYPLLLY